MKFFLSTWSAVFFSKTAETSPEVVATSLCDVGVGDCRSQIFYHVNSRRLTGPWLQLTISKILGYYLRRIGDAPRSQNAARTGLFCWYLFLFFAGSVAQAQYTFITSTTANQITITGYSGTSSVLMIPELINTLPVIAIDVGAFKNCPATSVSIGNNVISIGDSAFTSGSLTSLSLGSNVASIGDSAFQNCNGLTSVIFPASVTSIADNAFYPCTSLKYVIFMGNAPLFLPNLDLNPIYFPTTTAFKGYYFSPNTGFPNGVNAGVYSPVTPWLISKGIPYNANVLSAPRGDGVTLLMAYALNLDPTRNQSSLLPAPVFTGGQMKLTFYAGSAGITYSVEASPDLKSWSTSGVTITGPDINGLVTGSITISGSNRFMRLKVVKP